MGVLERGAVVGEILKQDLPSIFSAMLDAERVEHDSMKQLAIRTAFAGVLRQRTPSPEFFTQLRDFIGNSSNPAFERHLLIGALGSAGTTETTNFLISLVTSLSNKEMIGSAAGSIGETLDQNHENLAPAIERLWRESSDQGVVKAMSFTMARIGAASSIELLLSAALDGKDDMRKRAAWDALQTTTIAMLNPHAVPPLAARLVNQPPNSATSSFVRSVLAKMTIPEATQAMVAWLQTADASAAPLVHDYVLDTQNPAFWKAALAPSVPFRSEQNRAAIHAALVEYQASHQ